MCFLRKSEAFHYMKVKASRFGRENISSEKSKKAVLTIPFYRFLT